jgi:hypothetical protein
LSAVWETNVFGVLAVYQTMLPLLPAGSDNAAKLLIAADAEMHHGSLEDL